ncbi:MAG: hypothetical protein ISS56_11225 [Anaerolineae bacterium]|nr:hypothetical protein [Anaerolineae bacterium]
MVDQMSFSDLEAFAKECIAADRYPNDRHTFTMFRCDNGGVVPFELTVEHHTGSKKENFRGEILGVCSECGSKQRVFSFTGAHRKPLRVERPVCQCGHNEFLVGECERFEGDEGLTGFFDEGVVVGKCARCGQNRALVYTD